MLAERLTGCMAETWVVRQGWDSTWHKKKVTWTAGCYFRISKYEACGIKTGHIHWRESMHLCIYNFYPFILSNGLVSVVFILSYEFVNISWNGGILICYKMLHSGTNKQTQKKRATITHIFMKTKRSSFENALPSGKMWTSFSASCCGPRKWRHSKTMTCF